MAGISKRVSGAWQNTSYGIRATATDTITTLPTTIYADGTNATVSIKGNTVQSGTPTPTTPIQPQETGDETANLCYIDDVSLTWARQSTSLKNTFNQLSEGKYVITLKSTLTSRNDTSDASRTGFIVISSVSGASISYLQLWGLNDVGDSLLITVKFTITSETKGKFIDAYFYGCGINEVGATGSAIISDIMLNTGSTALPYEPYGVKIPISCGGTTNIYLGEVQTTRRIKKLVLTGQESGYGDWKKSATYQGSFYAKVLSDMGTQKEVICSHAEYVPTISASTYVYGKCSVDGSNPDRNLNLFIGEASWTVSDFKAYLQQQYAAGTPVTIWYALATPTTGIVNEPLMKIGDYADVVNNISIPTTDGANTLSVDTTIQPSEVSINYHGWHMGTVHERISGQWD